MKSSDIDSILHLFFIIIKLLLSLFISIILLVSFRPSFNFIFIISDNVYAFFNEISQTETPTRVFLRTLLFTSVSLIRGKRYATQ